ncbi:hypothetical protein BJ165DRAFT_1499191 [Panaeolus papilionaceus]|nr:hypothetical protein BJ165DRAFT_1499191 [Panaeolus papilionaceus]
MMADVSAIVFRGCTIFESLKVPTMEWLKLVLAILHREICEWSEQPGAFSDIDVLVVVKHPYLSAAILLFFAFFPTSPFYLIYYILYAIALSVLACIGFGRQGVRARSVASRYQSKYYGPRTPSNGFFSRSQSHGAGRNGSGDVAGLKWVWRFIGCLWAFLSIVVLLKYGGSS